MKRDGDRTIAVVGAGAAGGFCALLLARAGQKVVLIDRHAPPRYKTCGGGLTARARCELEKEVSLSGVIEEECPRAELHLARAGHRFAIQRPGSLVTMVRRSDLDARIVEAAREAGAVLRTPVTVTGLERCETGVRLHTDADQFEVSHVIAADGPTGPIAGAAAWPALPTCLPALESEIEVDEAVLARFRGTARFDFDFPRDGYAWVFPKARHLSIGCLATRRGRKGLRRTLEGYLAELELGPIHSREDHGALIPVAPRQGPLAREGVFLIGDAAGLVDPLICEGLCNAFRSARLAAEALIESGDRPGEAEGRYQVALEAGILPGLARARFLARICYGTPRLRDLLFRFKGQAMAEVIGNKLCSTGFAPG
jgi:geranylgeranyl reductase family protein